MKLRLTLHDKARFQDLFDRYGKLCQENENRPPNQCPIPENIIISKFWEDFENMLGDMFEVTCEEIPDGEVDAAPEPR